VAPIPRVAIIGGGLAGLAAAACLAEAGFEVEVVEKRAVLGGRASSFLPPDGGSPIDNCQHVLLGCCTNLLDFYRRAGTASRLRYYSSFFFLGPRGLSAVSAAALPAPLHLLPSLLRFRDLGWDDRRAIARGMLAILRHREPPREETMLAWLRRQRQTEGAMENFWRVVLTSALNEDLERVSSRHGFQVFWEAFLKNRRGYRMAVPAVPLSELYASRILGERCSLRLSTAAASLSCAEGKIARLELRDGGTVTADYFLSAVPPDALASLLPEEVAACWPQAAGLKRFEWSPITGIHLWFDRRVTQIAHAAVLGRTIQWVFNRVNASPQEDHAEKQQYLQVVVSASRTLAEMRREEILELVLRELRELFPAARQAQLLQAVIVKEMKATPSLQPDSESLRLNAQTPLPNLFLAGDWTATGWPATMEGAVRSGYRAAELITQAAGRPRSFLLPDLPTAPLARLLRLLLPASTSGGTF